METGAANRPVSTAHARGRALLEALVPVVAAQTYIWMMPHPRPRWADGLCGGLIAGFVIGGWIVSGPRRWRDFGLARSRDHLRAAGPLALLTAFAVGLLLLGGWYGHVLRREWDVLRALLAYPVWGLLQQGLMFGFVYPRLKQAAGVRWAPVLTAVVFGVLHTPNPLLMIGGALMVLGYALIWERAPSLPLLAVSHGIIGAVCDKALHVSMRVGAHYFGGH